LQSNKVRKCVGPFALIHSLDSLQLIEGIERAANDATRQVDALIQLNLAGETTKSGAAAIELDSLVGAARRCRSLRLRGLMVVPPYLEDSEALRPYFRQLRELRDRLLDRAVEPELLQELSMGMSHDFEVAIEEGATLIRVGTAIFGNRV